MQVKLSPSLLSADFSDLRGALKLTEEAGADYLHIDVMDGVFVPNITLGPCIIRSMRQHSTLTFDVHLMITEPIRYIREFAEAGADIITVHYEACQDCAATLREIRRLGKKVGLSVKPATPIAEIRPLLPLCDLCLVMSVEPGFGGQSYLSGSELRAEEVRRYRTEDGLSFEIEMDGGLSPKNAATVVKAGVDVIVAGSAFYGAENPKGVAAALKSL